MIVGTVLLVTLVLTRVGTFIAVVPIFGGSLLPHTVKIGLTGCLTIFYFMSSTAKLSPDAFESLSQMTIVTLVLCMGREMLLGALLGFLFSLFVIPLRVAGELLSQEMGLTMSTLLAPSGNHSSTVLAQFLEAVGTLLFFATDLHHLVFLALFHTFSTWPLGGAVLGDASIAGIVMSASRAQEWGVLIASPVLFCLVMTTVLLCILSRAAPTMNLFSLGMFVRLGVGLIALFLFFPTLLQLLAHAFVQARAVVLQLS